MQQVDELDLQKILKLLYLVTVAIVKLGTSDIRAPSYDDGARSTRDFSKQVCRESDQSYIDRVTMISFSGGMFKSYYGATQDLEVPECL